MSDDFGTVSVNRAERKRELDALRQQYRRHREALSHLIADAPTEQFASQYRALISELDASALKLDELEWQASGASEPGLRPLVTSPQPAYDEGQGSNSRMSLALIFVAALIALAAIGWLIWRASSDRDEPGTVVATTAPATVTEDATIAPAATVETLTASPRSADYGAIRKGTRATRQFEVTNSSEQSVSIQVARSTCRCLYYEYVELVPPKGKETITVTIDGARAKAGSLQETVKVTAKSDPAVATSFDVIATIR